MDLRLLTGAGDVNIVLLGCEQAWRTFALEVRWLLVPRSEVARRMIFFPEREADCVLSSDIESESHSGKTVPLQSDEFGWRVEALG